jgi:hypothetical protein
MPMNKKDFDFYYLIICSRGPGSETITVDKVTEQAKEIEFSETAEQEYKEFGVCGADASFNDEGPILCVPVGTMPLRGVYRWLVYDNERWKDSRGEVASALERVGAEQKFTNLAAQVNDIVDSVEQAFISACFRVFLTPHINRTDNPWTSVNAWRSLEVEMLSKEQFDVTMVAMDMTAEKLLGYDCAVLREAATRYLQGALPVRPFQGC